MATGSNNADVATVRLRLSLFWPSDLFLWFAQVEAQFATARVMNQLEKFHDILAVLSPQIAREVRNLIVTPPPENPYDALKAEPVNRTSLFEQQRLQQLLMSEELGEKHRRKCFVASSNCWATRPPRAEALSQNNPLSCALTFSPAVDFAAISAVQQNDKELEQLRLFPSRLIFQEVPLQTSSKK